MEHGRPRGPMVYSEPEGIPVNVGVSAPWHHLSGLFVLWDASSLWWYEQWWFTFWRGVVFSLLRSAADRNAPHCKHESHWNGCDGWRVRAGLKCIDVVCLCVFSMSIGCPSFLIPPFTGISLLGQSWNKCHPALFQRDCRSMPCVHVKR